MENLDNFYNILFVVHQLNTDILRKINDYEVSIMNSDNIKNKFYNIEFVYMHSIILDIAKLTSETGSDKSGIKELMKISPPDIKQEFEKLLSDNSNLLGKIKINRNKIIAHIDISEKYSYMKMGSSQIEIGRKIEDYKTYLKLSHIKPSKKDLAIITKFQEMKSSSSDIERYSPSDFSLDLPVFKNLLKTIMEISNKLNQHFYENN
jgi:hypothetical protein